MRGPIRSFFKSEPQRIITGLALFVAALVLSALNLPILSTVFYILTILIAGAPVFIDAAKGILRRDFLDEKFLMCLASIGASVIGEMTEGAAVMLFFLVGQYFEHKATRAARSSIRSLMEIRPDTATVITDEGECEVDAEDVEIGSLILVKPGERVAVDAIVESGYAEADTSAISGESVPRAIKAGDRIDSGAVILGAAITARSIRSCEDSCASRILSLVEEASDRKSREESFITVFSRYYTPIVTVLALLMAVLPPAFGWLNWQDALYRALSFLVVSCPCALVISVPMAFFGGIGGGAKRGVLYKGGNVFSAVARPRRVIFDKAGTLTTGEFELVSVHPEALDEDEFIRIMASAEHNSTHPIARGICRAANDILPTESLSEIPGRGIIALIGGKSIAVGSSALMKHVGADCPDISAAGCIFIAIDGVYEGYALLRDTVKPEAAEAITELKRLGVERTVILSGDKSESVSSVAAALGIDECHSELLPADKYAILESMLAEDGKRTVYVGDGINDAPCLARSDVGIAMGRRGSDSAIESADVVIMSDALDKIPLAVRCARKTIRIAKQNIAFAIGVKLLALILVGCGAVGMWLAVVADVGVAVLAILNSMRTLKGSSR